MTVKKTIKSWLEISLNVVDFKLFRLQLAFTHGDTFKFRQIHGRQVFSFPCVIQFG